VSGARLSQFSPIFPVKDLRRALAHYRSLGFVTRAYGDGDDYGFADRDGISLHLAADHDHDPEAGGSETYLYVDDADALYVEWTARGVGGLTHPVRDTAYNLREGAHVDPDGNLIRFGSPLLAPSSLDERLRSHLERGYGIEISKVSELDVGVFRVDRRDGPSWVARVFPLTRALEATAGDGEILRFLHVQDFPAERCATSEPVSVLEGRSLLLTEHAQALRGDERRTAIRDLGGLRHLGALLGRLHAMPEGTGAIARPGGGWHHLADGAPGDELAAAGAMLAAAEGTVAAHEQHHYDLFRAQVSSLDGCEGLPAALTHPDFVLQNVIATPDHRLVIVDWTGAGRAARLWSLAFLLFAEGAKAMARIDRVVAGYRQHVDLEPEELARLKMVVRARPITLLTWSLCMGRKSLPQAASELLATVELADAVGERAVAAFETS
jgi:Ser/Thr protein kinase RdoA (MazF antagonist)